MQDYETMIHALIDPLIEHKDSVMIRELPGGDKKSTTILIVAEDDDTACLIGKRGVVANALREAIDIAGKADNSNTRIRLKFESFDEDEKKGDDAK